MAARLEKALGAKFDIRGFHDTVLGGGALPLTPERRVDAWITSRKAGSGVLFVSSAGLQACHAQQ